MAQLRSELLKLRTTRTLRVLTLALALLVLAFALGQGLGVDALRLADESAQRDLFTTAAIGQLVAALAGIMTVAGEFRHGTIRPTFVFSPRREQVLGAKIATASLAGLALTALAQALALAAGYSALRGRGIELALGAGELGAIAGGTLAAGALWGGLGAGLGAIVRSQVGAVAGLLAWLLVAEGILYGLAPRYGRFAPGRASDALTGLPDGQLLAVAPATGLLVGYFVLLAALGAVSMLRRDVP